MGIEARLPTPVAPPRCGDFRPVLFLRLAMKLVSAIKGGTIR